MFGVLEWLPVPAQGTHLVVVQGLYYRGWCCIDRSVVSAVTLLVLYSRFLKIKVLNPPLTTKQLPWAWAV
jgi:uncharacterized integral membrane protein